jgi:MFS family permease
MIAATYAISAVLLALTGYLFYRGALSATSQTVLWTIIFFFASSAASSAYLTVSEIFPLETRGLAIAFFFSVGTGIGGVFGPWLFGELIATGDREPLMWGYLAAAALMLIAAITELFLGIDAEGKSLEDIAAPLASTPGGGADTSRVKFTATEIIVGNLPNA